MEVNGALGLFGCPCSSKYLLLCLTEERNSYRFGQVKDDRICIFGCLPHFSP